MINAKQWLQKAKDEGFAIGAFNVGNLETLKAIVTAAANKKSPIILESSPGETKWLGDDNLVDLARNFSEELGIPILVNLDHAESLEDCQAAIEAGYNMIHFDGSKLPLEENLKILKQVVELAHSKGLTCEGELDRIGGSSEVHTGSASDEVEKVTMTDPEEAKRFVQESGIDIFAAFVGNVHGLYDVGKNLEIDRVKAIAEATGVFLSLHGSSGILDGQLHEAIKSGIVKINLNTEMRQAFRETLEEVLKENPAEYAMYKVEQPILEAIQKIVEHKIDIFGSGNKF